MTAVIGHLWGVISVANPALWVAARAAECPSPRIEKVSNIVDSVAIRVRTVHFFNPGQLRSRWLRRPSHSIGHALHSLLHGNYTSWFHYISFLLIQAIGVDEDEGRSERVCLERTAKFR